MPPVHDSAVASVRPLARQRPSTISSTVRSSSREELAAEGPEQRPLQPFGRVLGAFLDEEIDVDLEAPGADRDLDPPPFTPGIVEGLGDGRLAGAEESEHAMAPRQRSVEDTPESLRSRRPRPEPAQLAGRPGQGDGHPPVVLDEHTGRGAREPDDDTAVGHQRLLADARREVRVRPAEPVGDPP